MERRTHEEFEKLHNFLQAEEESRMEALRREEEQKSEGVRQQIQELEEELSSLSETIKVLEEEMVLEDLSVLHVSLQMLEMHRTEGSHGSFEFIFAFFAEKQEYSGKVKAQL